MRLLWKDEKGQEGEAQDAQHNSSFYLLTLEQRRCLSLRANLFSNHAAFGGERMPKADDLAITNGASAL
jgi:hypothetical protein